jgi:hypothetical protein
LSTVNKDFKVKHGIQVAGSANVGGTVTAANPTLPAHLTTKEYVDSLIASSSMEVSATPPSSPINGMLWFDTITERINVYYEEQWLTVATIDDTLNIPDHIHDTSIDGNGLIVTRFVDAGSFNEPQGTPVSGGFPDTIDFNDTYNGGIVVDNFN